MDAPEIYAALDAAGLTPPVHWTAAPHEWRRALERIESLLADEVFTLNDEIQDLDSDVEHLKHQLETERDHIKVLEAKLSDAQRQPEAYGIRDETKDNAERLADMAIQAGATP